MSKFLFRNLKSFLPKITKNELVALQCGSNSIDTNILLNTMSLDKLPKKNNVKDVRNLIRTLQDSTSYQSTIYNGKQIDTNVMEKIKETTFVFFTCISVN